MTISRRGERHDYVRGAEVLRHEYSVYFAALRFAAMLGLLSALGSFFFFADGLLSADHKAILQARTTAQFQEWNNAPEAIVTVELVRDGLQKRYAVPAAQVGVVTEPLWPEVLRQLWWSAGLAVASGVMIFWFTNRAWKSFGRKVADDEFLRGAQWVEPDEMARTLRKEGRASEVSIGGVPLERGSEVLNTAISGAIGSGKSVAVFGMLDGVRKRGDRAIVFDPTGEYTEKFYREGRDVLLNPFDARGRPWTPWNEIRQEYDYAAVAASFLPVQNQKEPFWEQGAQMVLEDVLYRLARSGTVSNRQLVEVLSVVPLSEIRGLVERLPASVFLAEEAEKTGTGIRMNAIKAAKALRFMPDGAPEEQFSIRDWLQGDDDGWLFLSGRNDMMPALRPLLTAWLDVVVRGVMALPPSRERLIWQFIDELPALGKVESLLDAMTQARKYGLATVVGYQNFSQLRNIYGKDDAQTLVSNCQTVLTLRVSDYETARYIAESLGTQEISERDESLSFGKDPQRDGVSIATRRSERDLVMPSEIQSLKDCCGFLRLAGRHGVMRVNVKVQKRSSVAPAFVPREVQYALDE